MRNETLLLPSKIASNEPPLFLGSVGGESENTIIKNFECVDPSCLCGDLEADLCECHGRIVGYVCLDCGEYINALVTDCPAYSNALHRLMEAGV